MARLDPFVLEELEYLLYELGYLVCKFDILELSKFKYKFVLLNSWVRDRNRFRQFPYSVSALQPVPRSSTRLPVAEVQYIISTSSMWPMAAYKC